MTDGYSTRFIVANEAKLIFFLRVKYERKLMTQIPSTTEKINIQAI
jgi:hypothetical protein